MKTIYFDLIGGASGNMILGALIDAGLDVNALRAALDSLHLPGWSLQVERVSRRGIAATLVEVRVHAARDQAERRANDLIGVVTASGLDQDVRDKSTRILTRLAQVEAQTHNQRVEDVHLHEVGGLDTIVDVVGAVMALKLLGVERIVVSPVPLARGQIQMQHGVFPLPAPATVALLKDAPVVGVDGARETVTPTAAAILTTLASECGAVPRMTLRAVGYGAGSRDDQGHLGDATANVLRVLIGESETTSNTVIESVILLETNIDDMNPQLYNHLMARLFDAGALDVTLSPQQMKKNRPGTLLRVFAPVARADALRAIILNETTTLGVREQIVRRYVLPREVVSVETEFGALRAKIARRPNGARTVTPEYDDCARAAREHRVPIQMVIDAVKKNVEK